jgi:peptidoglycan/xylan/chitin deacetylase (PgdA/CDA1 family)
LKVAALVILGSVALTILPTGSATSCASPDALGIERIVEIDTVDGSRFGSSQYPGRDFLRSREIVLTFDDGPWPNTTQMVLAALAEHCTKATFFSIGKHALWHPEILRAVSAAGHTIGGHSWSHPYFSTLKPEEAVDEIEKGFTAIHLALGGPSPAPFFRFPYLDDPSIAIGHLAKRRIATFSHDVDSLDHVIGTPHAVVSSVLTSLNRTGKGIILLHDFQEATAKGALALLGALKAGGYKVVHI